MTMNEKFTMIGLTKQVQKNTFISYVLSEEVWWYSIKRFLSYSKNYICNFMQAKGWQIIPLQFDLLNLESVKNKRKKIQKFEYLENEKRFFIVFEGLSFGEKIKMWEKIVGTSFKSYIDE